jgi:uncharacterized protein YaiL (DUF2058 family)
MSFKDAFLAKGLVSKKDVRRVDDEARRKHKKSKSKQRKKRDLQTEAEQERLRLQEEAVRNRSAQRRQREVEEAARDLGPRVRQIILSNRIGSRGVYTFFHRAWKSPQLHRVKVSEAVAKQLRVGELGVVALDEETYVVVGKRAVEKLEQLDPSRVVFYRQAPAGPTEAAEGLSIALGEHDRTPDFRPRRATAADIERLRRIANESDG